MTFPLATQSTFSDVILSRMPERNDEQRENSSVDLRQMIMSLFFLMQTQASMGMRENGSRGMGFGGGFSPFSPRFIGMDEAAHEDEMRRQEELELQRQQVELLTQIRDDIRAMPGMAGTGQPADTGQGGMELPGVPMGLPGTPGGTDAPNKPKGRLARILTPGRMLATGGIAAGVAALGVGGALTYNRFANDANAARDKQLMDLEAARENQQITDSEYQAETSRIRTQHHEYTGGAIGAGAGLFATGLAAGKVGATGGAKLGAILGPKGAIVGGAIGGLGGGIAGAVAGTSVGRNIGGAIGLGVGRVRSFFGINQETIEEIERKTQKLKERNPERYEAYSAEIAKNQELLTEKHKDRLNSGQITPEDIQKLALVQTYESNRPLFQKLEAGRRIENITSSARNFISTSFSNISSTIGQGVNAAGQAVGTTFSAVKNFVSSPFSGNRGLLENFQPSQENIQPIIRNITESASQTGAQIEQLSRAITNTMASTTSAIQTIALNNDRVITQPFTANIHNQERTITSILRSY